MIILEQNKPIYLSILISADHHNNYLVCLLSLSLSPLSFTPPLSCSLPPSLPSPQEEEFNWLLKEEVHAVLKQLQDILKVNISSGVKFLFFTDLRSASSLPILTLPLVGENPN